MSLDKAIMYGKEYRRPYRGAKAVSCSCRNHGTCTYCELNRMYNTRKKLEKISYDLLTFSTESAIIEEQ